MRERLKKIYYRIRHKLFKNNLKNFEYTNLLFGYDLKSNIAKVGRDDFDDNVKSTLKKFIKRKDSEPTVSAIFRVKNGGEYLESSILSVVPLVSEVIVIDNLSIDNTREIVERLSIELSEIVDIKYYQYEKELEIAGDDYLNRISNNSDGSLAKFYNYCFSLGSSDYLMKCDSHTIFTLSGLISLRDALVSKPSRVLFSGCEIYGKHFEYEPSLFRNDRNFKFVDSNKWERLVFKSTHGVTVEMPVFLHIKRLSYIKGVLSDAAPAKYKYKS